MFLTLFWVSTQAVNHFFVLFSSGDKVLVFSLPECGECRFCLYPKGNMCVKEKLVLICLTSSHLCTFHWTRHWLWAKILFCHSVCLWNSVLSPTGLMLDGTSRFTCRGRKIHNLYGTSTFTEYTVVDEISVGKIDAAAPMDKVCVISCAVPTGFGAVFNTARVRIYFGILLSDYTMWNLEPCNQRALSYTVKAKMLFLFPF